MKTHPLDRKVFYYDDARFVYSINDLKSLIEAGKATTTESVVRITEGLSFRVGDIVKHTSVLYDLLSLAIDEPINY